MPTAAALSLAPGLPGTASWWAISTSTRLAGSEIHAVVLASAFERGEAVAGEVHDRGR